ncbi:hypothetical protein DM860_000020 [Cuscuta australis]|uniref:Uncharacterized protein n=1 Tax=Cuscuta australis TaxID=267555 RepID=A0A328CWB4_9ASTE|nr:hypothetical protein DM860_000020 [Cuscuta australis]
MTKKGLLLCLPKILSNLLSLNTTLVTADLIHLIQIQQGGIGKSILGEAIFPQRMRGCDEEDGEEEESVTSQQILDKSDTKIFFSEPLGDDDKALRFRHRVKRLAKET